MQVNPIGLINEYQGKYRFLTTFTPAQQDDFGLDEIQTYGQHVGDAPDQWTQAGPDSGDVYIDGQGPLGLSFPEDSKDPVAFMKKLKDHINLNMAAWIAQHGVVPAPAPAPSPTPTPALAFPTNFADLLPYCQAGGMYFTDQGPNQPRIWALLVDGPPTPV